MVESCVDCLKVRLSWTHGRDLLDESPLRGHEGQTDSSPPAPASNFSLLDVSWAHETQHPHTPLGVQIPIGQSRYQEHNSYFRPLCAGRKEGCRRPSGTDLQQNRLKTTHPAGARFYIYSHCCPSSLGQDNAPSRGTVLPLLTMLSFIFSVPLQSPIIPKTEWTLRDDMAGILGGCEEEGKWGWK